MKCAVRILVSVVVALLSARIGPAAGLLPEPPAGWTMRGEARSYTPQSLYEYIDGAADLFHAYGFVSLAHGDYGRGEATVTVDIYDMGTPLHALGIFGSERPEGVKLAALGQQGYVESGLAAFWQGRSYVKVSAVTGATDADAQSLAAATAALLPPGAGLPKELNRLPLTNRLSGSERYVRQGALGHRVLQEDVSAQYRVGTTTAEVHVADLGSAKQAAQGWRKLRDFEARAGKKLAAMKGLGEGAFTATDASLGDVVVARTGRFVVIAASPKAPRAALVQLAKDAVAGLK